MAGKISRFLREYVLSLSIITTLLGLFLFFMGIIWIFFRDSNDKITINLGFYTDNIQQFTNWNYYLLALGFIAFIFGVWYLYSYFKKRKFVLEELETNKRSELLKKRAELEDTVKHLPSKYKKMLEKKEEELRIE
jgi:hypothetical protein